MEEIKPGKVLRFQRKIYFTLTIWGSHKNSFFSHYLGELCLDLKPKVLFFLVARTIPPPLLVASHEKSLLFIKKKLGKTETYLNPPSKKKVFYPNQKHRLWTIGNSLKTRHNFFTSSNLSKTKPDVQCLRPGAGAAFKNVSAQQRQAAASMMDRSIGHSL